MTTQTEAERLAKALEGDHPAVPGARTKNEAAAELRRLVSFNQQLMDEVARLNRALAEQPAQQSAERVVPVAYRCWNNPKNADGAFDILRIWTSLKPEGYGNEPLYTTPQPPAQPVKWADYEPDGVRRKPLEERLKDAFYEGFTSSATYNDIELNDVDEEWLKYAAAHGITKGNT